MCHSYPEICMLKLNPQCDGGFFKRCLISHEWISVPVKETPESSLTLLPCEDTAKDTFYKPGSGHPVCWHLDLGLPVSETVRSKCLLLLIH